MGASWKPGAIQFGQLDSVWTTQSGWVDYGYDGWGRRVRVTYRSTGVKKNHVYDGDNIVTDYDASGNITARYSYYPGVDQPHSVQRTSTGGTYYLVKDVEGNVSGMLDSTGALITSFAYDPFGLQPSLPSGLSTRYRFKAREYDPETGFYFMRARYYDPVTRRFVSEDPIGLAGGINPYSFARNDPINYRDPSGLAYQLDEVRIVGRDRGPDWYASFDPILDQLWYSPTTSGGAGGGGTQRGVAKGVSDAWHMAQDLADSRCTAAIGGVVISVGLDFTGLRLLKTGYTAARTARGLTLASREAAAAGRRGAARRRAASARLPGELAQFQGSLFIADRAMAVVAGPHDGYEVLWSMVPVAGSVVAVGKAWGACSD